MKLRMVSARPMWLQPQRRVLLMELICLLLRFHLQPTVQLRIWWNSMSLRLPTEVQRITPVSLSTSMVLNTGSFFLGMVRSTQSMPTVDRKSFLLPECIRSTFVCIQKEHGFQLRTVVLADRTTAIQSSCVLRECLHIHRQVRIPFHMPRRCLHHLSMVKRQFLLIQLQTRPTSGVSDTTLDRLARINGSLLVARPGRVKSMQRVPATTAPLQIRAVELSPSHFLVQAITNWSMEQIWE